MNKLKKPQIAVRAFITNQKEEILILKRENTAYGNGLWNLPGGKINFGETAEESVKKEIFEETSLNCKSAKFLFYMDNLPDETTNLHFVALFFECKCTGDIKLNRESSDFKWINNDNLDGFHFAFGNDLAIKKFHELKELKYKLDEKSFF